MQQKLRDRQLAFEMDFNKDMTALGESQGPLIKLMEDEENAVEGAFYADDENHAESDICDREKLDVVECIGQADEDC